MNRETIPPDEEQLDRLLNEVTIPSDLHDNLLRIPELAEQQVAVQESVKPQTNWQLRSIIAIAAGYLMISLSLIFFWPDGHRCCREYFR